MNLQSTPCCVEGEVRQCQEAQQPHHLEGAVYPQRHYQNAGGGVRVAG